MLMKSVFLFSRKCNWKNQFLEFLIQTKINYDYNISGGRTADAIINTALSKVQSMVRDRMQGKSGSGGGGSGGGGGSQVSYHTMSRSG